MMEPTMNAVFTPQRFTFDVDQFRKMDAAGVFPPDTRLELVEGEIVTMAPPGNPHMFATDALNYALVQGISRAEGHVTVQNGVILSRHTLLQPDFLVLRPRADQYRGDRTGRDVLLAVEVSDSSLAYDRGRKRGLYAQAGVPEYWVLSIPDRRLEIFRSPRGDQYREACALDPGTKASLLTLPHVAIDWSVALD
jgi:Uma2 family endonuclease